MDYKYIVICSEFENAALSRTGYGIAIATECDGITVISESYNDLSMDKQAVEALVQKCNELKLSRVHLKDVVDDFI